MLNFLKKPVSKWILSALITGALILILARQIPIETAKVIFASLDWSWLWMAMLVFVVSTYIRSYRYRVLGLAKISFHKLVSISYVHNFLSNVLPFRSGELSFVYLVNRDRETALPLNVSALVLARVFDFLVVALGLLVSLVVLFPEKILKFDPIVISAVGALVILFLILIALVFAGSLITICLRFLLKLLGKRYENFSLKILQYWQELSEALKVLRNFSIFIKIFLASLLGWALLYVGTVVLLRAISYDFGFWQAVFLTSFPPIASLIPIGTIGNFGTVEAGWTFGLTILGLPLELAVAVSIALHILTLFFQLLAAIFGTILLRFFHE